MKHFGIFVVSIMFCLSLLGCASRATEMARTYASFTKYDYKTGDLALDNCPELNLKELWSNYHSYQIIYKYDDTVNPTIVTATIIPSFYDEQGYRGYITAFGDPNNKYDLITVHKGRQEITGALRDQIIDQTLKKINGIYYVLVTYTLSIDERGELFVSDVSCVTP